MLIQKVILTKTPLKKNTSSFNIYENDRYETLKDALTCDVTRAQFYVSQSQRDVIAVAGEFT